jgi:HlyD family secretion protein
VTRRALTAVLVLASLVALGVARWRSEPEGVAVDVGEAVRQAEFRSTVTASGEIVAGRYADIGSDVMGKIVELAVAEGDTVNEGQILARLDPVQARSEAAAAAEQVRALAAEERASAEQARAAADEAAAAQARARDAEQRLARARDLHAQQLIPNSELDAAMAGAEAAAAQASAARAFVERAQQVLTAAARRVDQARAQQVRADDIERKTSIVSPLAGIVSRLQVREGEMVVVGLQNQPGTTLMTISDLSSVNAEVKVAEADVLQIDLEQAADVRLEALPGKRFPGRVVEVGASALPLVGAAAAAREFRVVIRLDSPDPGMRPGLTCDAEIVTSVRRDVVTVPLQSVVLRGNGDGEEQPGVFAVRDGRASFLPVRQGPIGGLDIEVGGVDDGTPIIVGPYQVLRDLQDGTAVRAPAAGR